LPSDPSSVPLALVIGLASDSPGVGWLFGTSIYAVHAIVRVAVVVAIRLLWTAARFTWPPLSIAVVYAVTVLPVVYRYGRPGGVPGQVCRRLVPQDITWEECLLTARLVAPWRRCVKGVGRCGGLGAVTASGG